MKKTFNNFRTLAALLMAGAAFAACSSDDNIIENQQPATSGEQVYTLTINASKGDGTTRALDLDGTGKLTASWTNGDELTVVNQTKSYTALGGTLTASNASGNTAAFSGALTGTIEVNDVLILNYHQHNYFTEFPNQDGTLKGTNGAEKYDVANAEVTVASVDVDGDNKTITTTGDASFKTWTAMLKLTLQDNAATPNKLNATSLTISVEGIADFLTFSSIAADASTANGDGVLYFALPNAENVAYIKMGASPSDIAEKKATLAAATVTFTATAGGKTYTATKPGYKFTEGKYYAATLTMAEAAPAAATGHALSASVVGEVVGTDGMAYDVADKDNLPTGVTAAGMVAYKSGSNGLVIALADEASTMNWSTANGASGAAAHTPTVSGQTWKLPSENEWKQMFNANGGNENKCAGLNTAIGNAGGTALQNGYYWSSDEFYDSDEGEIVVRYVHFNNNGDASFSAGGKNPTNQVRACLAF